MGQNWHKKGVNKMSIKKLLLITIIASIACFSYYFKKNNDTKVSPYKLYADLIPGTYRIGFTNLDEEISINDLEITGKIPDWLSGTLFRNGPAKFSANNSYTDWFDGLAMVHAFSFNNSKVSYANKYLKTDDYTHVEKYSNMNYGGFAKDPCKSIFKKFFSLFIPEKKQFNMPNANVNIAKYGDHLIALTEVPLPIEFDKETLETLGIFNYNDKYPHKQIHESAHPHYDPEKKENLSYFTKFGRQSFLNLYRIKDGSQEREIITSIEVDNPSYMHSFAITKNYAILTAIPLVVNPLDLITKNQAFIKNFKWKPELGTKFIVIDRINNKLKDIFKAEPFFTFHHVNAFEKDNQIIVDIVTYPDSSSIAQADMANILKPINKKDNDSMKHYQCDDTGRLKRFIINLDSKIVDSKILAEEFIELPRINYEKYNSKEYSYVYAFSKKLPGIPYVADKLVKININDGDTKIWQEEFCYPSEPVFVSSPNAKEEDDGVVLSVILDAKKERSFLLILDAKEFKEIARAQVPHHIPFGIHGAFFSNLDLNFK